MADLDALEELERFANYSPSVVVPSQYYLKLLRVARAACVVVDNDRRLKHSHVPDHEMHLAFCAMESSVSALRGSTGNGGGE